jgi:hypothetical protein
MYERDSLAGSLSTCMRETASLGLRVYIGVTASPGHGEDV